ncbi:MAG: S41 family peptidase [Chloroflexota bacterium]
MAALLAALSFASGFLAARYDPLPLQVPALVSSKPWGTGQPGQPAVSQAPGGRGASTDSRPPSDLGGEFDVFWEAWNFVEREYYRQPVDRARLVRGAIKGMLRELDDQQAAYLDPVANRIEKANLDGIIEGIGASVEMKERRHTIVAPLDDSPAARVGLRSGDVILRVDGQDIGALSLAEAVALIRGPAGTKVKLIVERADDPDGQPVEVEITRARIELQSVTSEQVAEGIGYVRIRFFGTHTVPQLTRALREMRSRRVRGLILDLRDNPGGYLSSAVDVASQFLKDGSVVVYEEREGIRRPSLARGRGLATDLTVAVLVNGGSASASEIVAGAIRDHGRGVVIGEPTFGKGTVQLPRDLSDGSSVRVTVGTWLTPAGKRIQGHGLTPKIEAKPTPEDEQAGRDVALEKALEWFKVAPAQEAAG